MPWNTCSVFILPKCGFNLFADPQTNTKQQQKYLIFKQREKEVIEECVAVVDCCTQTYMKISTEKEKEFYTVESVIFP